MIQTAMTAQELYAKAVLVDHDKLNDYQMKGDYIYAEECLKSAFNTDVAPGHSRMAQEPGSGGSIPVAFRDNERAERERSAKNKGAVAEGCSYWRLAIDDG